MQKYDLIIIGGGILGLSHAYHALKLKKKVLLLEKNNIALGASVRNFGQIVPSGFGAEWQAYGRASVRHYMDIHAVADIAIRKGGSIYLASDEDEMTLLEELTAINKANDYHSELLSAAECKEKYPALKEKYCMGGLFFPDEINADSSMTIPLLTFYLVKGLGLDLAFSRLVNDVYASTHEVIAFDHKGDKWVGDKIIICNGDDFSTLYPEVFSDSDIEVVKLQMLETIPQQPSVKLAGSILTGWTIRRYESFQECPSFPTIKAKEDRNNFQHLNGIHILFKQTSTGSVILGDSHIYADINDRDYLRLFETDETINRFIIDASEEIFDIDYTIAKTWIGSYSQCKSGDLFEKTIDDKIHIVTAIGGKGMTGSLGWAEKYIQKIF